MIFNTPLSMMRLQWILPLSLLVCFASSAQEKTEWTDNYESAVATARTQGKDLLLLFTGDWIPLCQKFEESILKSDSFLEEVSEQFVLVRLNFPESNRLPPAMAAQNQLLKDAYRIRGYPAIVLTDDTGRPYGINGFQPVTAKAYTDQILGMHNLGQEKEKARDSAKSLDGIAKAEMLIEGIPDLPGNMAASYFGEEMKAVISSDPEDSLGKSALFESLLHDADYRKSMHLLAKESKWDRMIELTDSYIADQNLSGGMLQRALLNKSSVQKQIGSSRGRIETLLQVVDIDEESPYGKEAQRQLDELRSEKMKEESEGAAEQP